jgi:hypothetical protein
MSPLAFVSKRRGLKLGSPSAGSQGPASNFIPNSSDILLVPRRSRTIIGWRCIGLMAVYRPSSLSWSGYRRER